MASNPPPMPHGLMILAEAVGTEVALRIAMARRGTRLRIPKRAEGSILVSLVGIDAARTLVRELADVEIEIPLAKEVLAHWMRDQGASVAEIANRLGIAPRTLQYWFSDTTPTAQPDLFASLGR